MGSDKELGKWLKAMQLPYPLVVAGPCSAESETQVLETARQLSVADSKVKVFRAGVWKPRTRPNSFEGVGEQALPWLRRVKEEMGLLVAIEVANAYHVQKALEYDMDILWLGARTTVNPFTVQEIAEALRGTDKIVWVKNPVNPDLSLWIGAFERLANLGITNLGAIHRGFSIYNKSNYRNQPQWQIPIDFKTELPEIPMICDPSHICGRRDTIAGVAQTALDLQFDGLMIETHPNPEKALSDAFQQLKPADLHTILERLVVRKKDFKDELFRNKLGVLRDEIDDIDQKLIILLADRIKVANRIGEFKKEQNVAVLQNERFNKIMDKMLQQATELHLSRDFVAEVFKAIHQESIAQQERVVNDKK